MFCTSLKIVAFALKMLLSNHSFKFTDEQLRSINIQYSRQGTPTVVKILFCKENSKVKLGDQGQIIRVAISKGS